MTYLIMDTNQWIYLANSRDPMNDNFQEGHHFKLMEILGDLVINGKVKIVISELIKREWQRNRVSAQDLIKKIENCRDGIVSQLEKVKKTLNGTVNNEIDIVIAAIKRKYNDEIKRNQTHIEQVESLLLGSEVYTVSKETKITVTDWALDKKAPFKGDKSNSMADALILFGAVDYIKSKISPDWLDRLTYPDSIFVSANKKDFSSPINNDEIHEDLTELTESVRMKYSKSLPLALKEVDKFILLEEEISLMEEDIEIWTSREISSCLACDGDGETQFMSIVTFGEPFEISNEDPLNNNGQIEIPFSDLHPPQKKTTLIQIGYCQRCSTTHLKCSCGEIISLENSKDGEIIKCEGCNISYQTFYDYDGDGLFEERIMLPID